MIKCDFNKVAKHTSTWLFSSKFDAYFQNNVFRTTLDDCF